MTIATLRNERGRLRTAEGFVYVAVPQVRGTGEPFRSPLTGVLDGNSEVLESLVNQMYARGLSMRQAGDPLPRGQKIARPDRPEVDRVVSISEHGHTASGPQLP